MAIDGIQSTLQTLQGVANQAAGVQAKAVNDGATGFASELHQSLRKVNQLKIDSDAQVRDFQMGVPGVSLQDVMVDMQKSSLAMTMATQVRNKLVSSYKDIMAMPV